MNRLFVVNKPIFRGSNSYMNHIKRKYNTNKVGFSGTLDPFATGCLIVATGQYTKLFNYLHKTPKCYRATLWLGANSPSLDIENVDVIETIPPIEKTKIEKTLHSLKGELSYYPPKYSAKKVGGERAYNLARKGKEVTLKQITSTIYNTTLLHYTHPFIHFEVTVSEGAYIRSLGAMVAAKLGVNATLSSLHRVSEGVFSFDNERALNPFEHLVIPTNVYKGEESDIELGKKLQAAHFIYQKNGTYLVKTSHFYSIIEITNQQVHYKLNRIEPYRQS
jgi:tRNA pseudouridine55 synthase